MNTPGTQHERTGLAAGGRRTGRPRGGFTLLEIMFAVLILGIGFIAIASIFPAASVMQRETVQDAESDTIRRNATASLKARPIDGPLDQWLDNHLNTSDWDIDRQVYSMPPELVGPASGSIIPMWSLYDRSFPGIAPLTERQKELLADPDVDYRPPQAEPAGRRYYWVPLIRDREEAANDHDWQVFVFILARNDNTVYRRGTLSNPAPDSSEWAVPLSISRGRFVPGVLSIGASVDSGDLSRLEFENDANDDNRADRIVAGDWFLTNTGVIHRARRADPGGLEIEGFFGDAERIDYLWYAPPAAPGQSSPTVEIETVTVEESS